MAKVIDGKAVAAEVVAKVTQATADLSNAGGPRPGIAVIIVGEDPASQVYVASKGRMAKQCGFHSVQHRLRADTGQAELLALVEQLNSDDTIHGILVQLPLPVGLDAGGVVQAISPQKDVDGFHFINVGMLATGVVDDAFVPCTPAGSMLLVETIHGRDLSGMNAVVVGRSNIVGKPMANMLLAANATVTVAHSRTKNIETLCRSADILVAAVGRPEMIRGSWIKPGATVIDVGINRIAAKDGGKVRLVGDVAYDEAAERAGAIAPVPGGVGPMTIALLMANTLRSAFRVAGRTPPRI